MPVMGSSSPSSSAPVLRHVAMLPFMAKGHAMPLLYLARLLLRRGLAGAVTFLATPRDAPFIRSAVAMEGATVVELPFPSSVGGPQSTEDLDDPGSHFVDVVAASASLRPAFADALAGLDPRPDLLVHDGFLPWAREAADALGVPRMVCNGTGAFSSYVCFAVHAQKPHARVRSPAEPFELDGLPGLRLTKADLPPPFDEPDPAGPHWDFVAASTAAMVTCRGIVLNSFRALESTYVDRWNREVPVKMWPVGPLCLAATVGSEPAVVTPTSTGDRDDLSEWLDARLAMDRPVLYVAFGSQAHLSRAQLEEIAAGLDRSGLDFVWVVRSRWFDDDQEEGKKALFEESRFGDRGRVVRGFVDQLGTLRHGAVRGFLSHCGWNSVLESVSAGVPVLAFPLGAEQRLNAKYVVDVLGVGLRVWPTTTKKDAVDGEAAGDDGLVVSGDVEALARELILGEGGKRAAEKVRALAASARSAMDAGGSSFESLERMVREVAQNTSE